MQLINPGYNSRIKVYHHPNANKTQAITGSNIDIVGGEDKSYLVVKDGKRAEIIKKKNYRNAFGALIGDCSEYIKYMVDQKISFWDMATHVFHYDTTCGN